MQRIIYCNFDWLPW